MKMVLAEKPSVASVLTCSHCQQSIAADDDIYRCRQRRLKVPKPVAGKKANQRSLKTLLGKRGTLGVKRVQSQGGPLV